MQTADPQKALIQWLHDQLRQGIALSREVTDYMEATFGSADLRDVLTESDDTETDSLMELIFYPELEIQQRYEANWGDQCFTAAQQTAVAEALCAMAMVVPLEQSATGERLSIRPPDFALTAFVQRLNITYRPDATLVSAIQASWPGESGLRARVLMRNACRAWDRHQKQFLERFFDKVGADTAEADQVLPFLLSILAELAPDQGEFEFCIAKKFFYFQSLCKAEDFERRRQSSNMEVMMLQGHRAAHGSIDEWRRKMRLIDIICQHLFGRTHFFQQPGNECIDLEAGDGKQTIQNVIRILS